MPVLLAEISWPLSWFLGLGEWLITPSIVPSIGMIAAIGAALTIRPKDWLTSPKTLLLRAIQVTSVWLLLVFLLGMFTPGKPGYDDGSGKRGEGNKNQSNAGEETSENQAPSVLVKAVPAPSGGKAFDVTVRFVASKANASLAQDFACDLILAGDENGGTQVEIRAETMDDFEVLLVKQLRDFKASNDNRPVAVRVESNPSPGQSVLRIIVGRIRVVLEDCEVSVGGPE